MIVTFVKHERTLPHLLKRKLTFNTQKNTCGDPATIEPAKRTSVQYCDLKNSFVLAPPNNTLTRLVNDNQGIVLSVELVLTAVVALVGLIVTFAAIRDSLTSEISDVAGSVQDMNQSYSYNGVVGSSSTNPGSSFDDELDIVDDPDDIAGQVDNCITFDEPPVDELLPIVSDDDQVALFPLILVPTIHPRLVGRTTESFKVEPRLSTENLFLME